MLMNAHHLRQIFTLYLLYDDTHPLTWKPLVIRGKTKSARVLPSRLSQARTLFSLPTAPDPGQAGSRSPPLLPFCSPPHLTASPLSSQRYPLDTEASKTLGCRSLRATLSPTKAWVRNVVLSFYLSLASHFHLSTPLCGVELSHAHETTNSKLRNQCLARGFDIHK